MGTSNILVGAPVTGTGGVLRGPLGTTTPTDVMAIGDDKKLKSKISIGERYNKPCSSEIDTCGGMAVTDDQIKAAVRKVADQ